MISRVVAWRRAGITAKRKKNKLILEEGGCSDASNELFELRITHIRKERRPVKYEAESRERYKNGAPVPITPPAKLK